MMSDRFEEWAQKEWPIRVGTPMEEDDKRIQRIVAMCLRDYEKCEGGTCETCFQHNTCGIEQMIRSKGFVVPHRPFGCNRYRRIVEVANE
jgi:hypothetical protein